MWVCSLSVNPFASYYDSEECTIYIFTSSSFKFGFFQVRKWPPGSVDNDLDFGLRVAGSSLRGAYIFYDLIFPFRIIREQWSPVIGALQVREPGRAPKDSSFLRNRVSAFISRIIKSNGALLKRPRRFGNAADLGSQSIARSAEQIRFLILSK